jgi:hypothetical protein
VPSQASDLHCLALKGKVPGPHQGQRHARPVDANRRPVLQCARSFPSRCSPPPSRSQISRRQQSGDATAFAHSDRPSRRPLAPGRGQRDARNHPEAAASPRTRRAAAPAWEQPRAPSAPDECVPGTVPPPLTSALAAPGRPPGFDQAKLVIKRRAWSPPSARAPRTPWRCRHVRTPGTGARAGRAPAPRSTCAPRPDRAHRPRTRRTPSRCLRRTGATGLR